MAPSLENLSSNILFEIIEWVGTDSYYPHYGFVTAQGTKFLYQLALCSRRLNMATIPVLYSTFTQTGTAALPAFTKRVLGNPKLGAHVKKFVGSSISYDETLDMSSYSEEDFKRCLDAIQAVGGTEAVLGEWMEKVREGSWDAVAGVLVSLLPNIEVFEMASFSGEESPYMSQVLDLAARRQSTGSAEQFSLKNLTTLSFAYSDTEMGFSVDSVMPYCKVESVRKIHLHMAADEFFPVSSERFRCEDLAINYSSIDGDALINFLRCFPCLKKLSYDHGGSIVGDSDFLPQKVGEAITHLKPCLEELLITNNTQEDVYVEEEMEAMGSLAGFEKLHTVVTSTKILLGPWDEEIDDEADDEENGSAEASNLRMVDVLPRSLKVLGLSGCRRGVMDQVREVIERKDELVPALEGITLQYRDPRPGVGDGATRGEPHIYPGYDKEVAEKLKDDCKAVGVDLVVSLAQM
jgi:hypothetical protein